MHRSTDSEPTVGFRDNPLQIACSITKKAPFPRPAWRCHQCVAHLESSLHALCNLTSESGTLLMPPRRSHKKSRAGCRRCKNRKIKVRKKRFIKKNWSGKEMDKHPYLCVWELLANIFYALRCMKLMRSIVLLYSAMKSIRAAEIARNMVSCATSRAAKCSTNCIHFPPRSPGALKHPYPRRHHQAR